MKLYFRFPELLLVIALALTPLVIGNTAFDIRNAIFIPFTLPLILTWVIHIYCRKHGVLSVKLKWAQVLLTLLCMIAIVALLYSLSHSYNTKPEGPTIFRRVNADTTALKWVQIVFLANQVVFWLIVRILSIRKIVKTGKSQIPAHPVE